MLFDRVPKFGAFAEFREIWWEEEEPAADETPTPAAPFKRRPEKALIGDGFHMELFIH